MDKIRHGIEKIHGCIETAQPQLDRARFWEVHESHNDIEHHVHQTKLLLQEAVSWCDTVLAEVEATDND